MRNVLSISGLILTVLSPVAAVAQSTGQQERAPATVSAEVVSTCVDAQQRSLRLLDAINERVEMSRQTNGPAEMRAAMADVQRALLEARNELGRCATLAQAAAIDPHAGHTMPSAEGAPAVPPSSQADPHAGHVMPTPPSASAANPAAPAATQPQAGAPRATAPASRPAPAAADPHAGHVMPTPPSATVTKPATPAATQPDLVEDPVSKTQVDPRTALRALYQGRMYYFRSDKERQEFMKNPRKYLSAK